MLVDLSLVGEAPSISDAMLNGHGTDFKCQFYPGGNDGFPVGMSTTGCPFLRNRAVNGEAVENVTSPAAEQHCYVLNKPLGYNLMWVLDGSNLVVEISSPALSGNVEGTYVAIGFRPLSRVADERLSDLGTGRTNNFGMGGADIVLGSVGGGVRTLYADQYVGAPVADDSVPLNNTSVSYDQASNRVTVRFTRSIYGGHLLSKFGVPTNLVDQASDVIWAVGLENGDATHTPGYHVANRGLRVVDWQSPEIAMAKAWKC